MINFKKKFFQFYGPSILSGVLLFLSFPKIDIFPLAWIALAPLLIFLYGRDRKESFKAGLFFGIVYFFSTIYWIYHSIHIYGSIPLLPSLLLVLFLCLYLSLYPAVFAVIYCKLIKKTDLPALFIAPVAWTVLEFARSYALTGFPWSSLGYSQYKFLPFIQIADITGVYGISFLLMAFNGAIADIFLLKRRRADRPLYSLLPTFIGFSLLALFIVSAFSYGFYRLSQKIDSSTIRAAIVQGNIEQDKKWDPSYQQEVMTVYKDLTSSVAQRSPDIIIWPETAVPFIFGRDKALTEDLINFQRETNSYLLFGGVLLKENSKNKAPLLTNSAILLDRDGKISYIYDKIHLVPFGEYVPLKGLLFFVDKLVVAVGDFAPGDSYTKALTPFGNFSTLICYEIIFPRLVRKFYTKGGDFILTITNDAWFGNTSGPHQHFSMAVFRAIENRKPVLRAANSGISGYIDSRGRILQKTGLFERTFMIRDFATDKTLTTYTRLGDIFSYLCIVSFLFLLRLLLKIK